MERTMGFAFEQAHIGDKIESPGRTITEADIVAFAGLSGDWNAMHTDAEYAKKTMFGQRVAHGLLVLSVASGLAVRMGFTEESVKAFLGLDWKFRAPVFIGDTVRLRATIAKKHAMPRLGGGIVVLNVEVVNQEGKTVQKGQWEVLAASEAGGA